MIEQIDLRIFKVITTNKIDALTFAQTYNYDLFHEKLFGRLILAYLRAFRDVPTRRTLKEWTEGQYNDYIEACWNQMDRLDYNLSEYRFDLEQLKKRYIAETISEIQEYAVDTNNSDKILKDIALKIQTIKTVQTGRSFVQETVKEHFDEFKEHYEAVQDNPESDERILTHYSTLDEATGGLRPAEMFLIGAETNGGKSMLLMNMAIQMWMQQNTLDRSPCDFDHGFNICYFSLEMPYKDCYTRFLARMAQVPERSIIDRCLSSEEYERIKAVERFLKEYPYEFDIIDVPRGLTVDEIELRYNDSLLKYQPHVMIVDYLGIMHGIDENEPDWLKLGNVAGQLHEFGRFANVVTGSAVQLTDIQRNSNTDANKKSENQKVGPHRIGRSSHILHHANMALQIETRSNEDRYGDMPYHIIKNRRGPRLKGNLIKKMAMCSLLDNPSFNSGPDKLNENDISKELQSLTASDLARQRIAEKTGRPYVPPQDDNG